MIEASQQFSLYSLFRLVTICAVAMGIARALGLIGLTRLGLLLLILLALPAFAFAIVIGLRAAVDFVLRPFFLQ